MNCKKRKGKSDFNVMVPPKGDFPGGSVVKNPPANPGDAGSIPGSGRSPGVGNGNPLQYSCLENQSHGQRSLVAAGYRVRKSRTWLKWLSMQCTEKSGLPESRLFKCGAWICIRIFLTAQPPPTLPPTERSSAYLPSSLSVTSGVCMYGLFPALQNVKLP